MIFLVEFLPQKLLKVAKIPIHCQHLCTKPRFAHVCLMHTESEISQMFFTSVKCDLKNQRVHRRHDHNGVKCFKAQMSGSYFDTLVFFLAGFYYQQSKILKHIVTNNILCSGYRKIQFSNARVTEIEDLFKIQ